MAEEIGAVRSGLTPNDEALQFSLRARLNMLQACDAVLCSTQALRRELNSLGLPVIHSPNLIEDSVFQKGALRLSAERPAGGLRILYASGTPTHSADFGRSGTS